MIAAGTGTGTSIWSSSTIPDVPFASSPGLNVGVKFRSDTAGTITGMRFYKGMRMDAVASLTPHGGAAGTSDVFRRDSIRMAAGQFCNGAAISANTTYVASLYTSSGFAFSAGYFTGKGADSAPLHALQSGVDGGNGVYAYASGPQFRFPPAAITTTGWM